VSGSQCQGSQCRPPGWPLSKGAGISMPNLNIKFITAFVKDKAFGEWNSIPQSAQKKRTFPIIVIDTSLYIGFTYLIYLKKKKVSPPFYHIFVGFIDKPIPYSWITTIPYRFYNIAYYSLYCPVYHLQVPPPRGGGQ
jgi:hypothetical protein